MGATSADAAKGSEESTASPQKRRPVPRSRTIGAWPGASSDTHEVLPPYRRLASQEHGVDPRTPKKVTLSSGFPPGSYPSWGGGHGTPDLRWRGGRVTEVSPILRSGRP